MMFSRRRSLDRRKKYSKEFFISLIQQLKEAGFSEFSIVLPHNYETVNPKHSIISVDEFVNKERNYTAIILIAKKKVHNELLKILFVNSSAKSIFLDDTFPSATSEPPALYFQSSDPARTYALFEYFYEILSQEKPWNFILNSIINLFSLIFIASEFIYLGAKKRLLISGQFDLPIYVDIVISIIFMVFIFKFFKLPTGLWIKPKRETKILSMVKMAIRGELKDNPIVQFAIVIIGGIIVLLLSKLFF